MALEFKDGRITGSSGVAKAGLTLGIIGTGLAALGNNGGNWLGNLFGGGTSRAEEEQSTIAALESKVAKLEANRYTDYVGIDLYKNIVATAKEEDAKIAKVQSEMIGYVIDLDKRTALNEQASRLNREYDTAARDYMFTILNNKIDCCCEKAAMQVEFNRQLGALADSSIVSWVQSNYLPGTLKLPVTSICPQPTTTA
jgi:hypothetical protein